ncbi:MAG: hypothetical protein PHW77_01625 [Eubacteriales bacterium]|nr:hypothetical protein [Eubacteriales bacterium]
MNKEFFDALDAMSRERLDAMSRERLDAMSRDIYSLRIFQKG